MDFDERSQKATQLFENEARERARQVKTYQVIVIGRNNNQPFEINAIDRDDRMRQMAQAGVTLSGNRADKWAAGYYDRAKGKNELAGNDDKAKRLLEQHLRKMH